MKKVVVFYPYTTGDKAFSGGVPKVVVSNIMAIHRNGGKPYLILPSDNAGLITYVREHLPYCQIRPIDFATLSLFSDTPNLLVRAKLILTNLFHFLWGKSQLIQTFKQIQPDVIHYHEVGCFNLLGLYPSAKIILHVHSYRFTGYRWVAPKVYEAINQHATRVIVPTASIAQAISPHVEKEVVFVQTPYLDLSQMGGGTSLGPLKALAETKIVFSFIGRICEIKRVHHFLEAMALLPDELRNRMVFAIIGGCNTPGDESYKAKLINLIQRETLQESVNFVGYVNPIESALPYIHYGVMLTESEAMPMVGVEYMRCNVPILAYAAPGIVDFMVDRETGFLIENGCVDKLKETLEHILKNEDIPDFKTIIPTHFQGYSLNAFAEVLKRVYS